MSAEKRNDLGKIIKEGGRKAVSANNVATSRRDEVVELRNGGLSYAEIGRRSGISRERVRQIIKGIPTPQKPDLDSKIMLTTTDVARLLGLHSNTVRRWNTKRILKSYRIGSRGDRRFKREDIDSFLQGAEIE